MAPITVRPARAADAPLILSFVQELAAYERLAHEVEARAGDIEALLFGAAPRAFCEIAMAGEAAVGFALWFYSVSTFQGRHGLHLEDLYVRPQARGLGAGKALLRSLAARCVAEGLGRLEWVVLDWNAPAQAFYDSLGATTRSQWLGRRLAGEALERLAAEG